MNFNTNGSAMRKCVGLAFLVGMSATAFAQHRPSAPAPHQSAPAPRTSAPPSHASAPRSTGPSQHSAMPSRTNTNTQSRGMTPSTGHSNASPTTRTGSNTMGRPANNANSRLGTANGNRGMTTANGNRGMTANGNRGTTANGNRGTTANGRTASNNVARPGSSNGRPAVGKTGVTATGRSGTTMAGRGSMNRTPPGRQVSLKGGGSAHIRPNGQIRSVNRNGMQIQHNLHGGRTIVSNRNGARVVTRGGHGGYVQRAYVTRGGRSYYSRTYYYHGEYRSVVYRDYYYGGRPYYGYYPAYYYAPVYYGWAYNPWPAPVYYGWGWGAAPWYGYYGAYFTPYPVYPSAAFWLTDYLIAANLQAAYAASAEVGKVGPPASDQLVASMGAIPAPDSKALALNPELKTAIAEEVKAELAAEQALAKNAGSSSGQQGTGATANKEELPPALDPARRIFIVSDDLSVVADGEECSLTQGDVITRLTDKPDDDNNVNVSVSASKKGDCAAGKQVAVDVDDLQEMHNHFREQLTSGMGDLAKKQGKDGLPKAPDTSTVKGDVPPPPADKTAAKTLEEQEKAADHTEADVKQEASSSGGGSQ